MIAMSGDDDRRDRGVEQDREEHPDGGRRQEVTEDSRPAVILRASVVPTTSRPMRISTLSRCQSAGRKRQIQASSIATSRTASRNQPAKLATSTAPPRRGRARSIVSMSAASAAPRCGRRPGPGTIDTADRRRRPRRPRSRGLVVERLVERRVGHDQRRDELGGEHPLGLVEVAGHPAGQLRPRLGHLGVAQLGPQGRVEDPGRLGPDRRPAWRVDGQRASRVAVVRQVRDRRLEQRAAFLGGQVGRERGVDPLRPAGRTRAPARRRWRSPSRS